MVFILKGIVLICHNPYFNRWFSAIILYRPNKGGKKRVTILILIDGFLQFKYDGCNWNKEEGHNPYFNRWFSAITWVFIICIPYIGSQSLF